MNIDDYKKIINKYENKYTPKFEQTKKKCFLCMKNYDKNSFKINMLNYRNLIKSLICDVIDEFDEFKKIKCCVMLNGSLARATNTLYSDIDINYFYTNENFEKMINIEERVNYILQTIMKYRGKDRIHSMVVYMPLITNKKYEAISQNKYPIYFDDGIIYNKCRANADQLMYEMFNSTRDIGDLCNYLNINDNVSNINEWANCFELVYDNGLYNEFKNNRKVFKSNENISKFIDKNLNSIKKDNFYIDENENTVKIKDLKNYYKMNVLHNAYDILAIYFRLNKNVKTINIFDYEENHDKISKDFYDNFYEYLNLIQKLQYLLDLDNMDLSIHSTKQISCNNLNKKYKEIFNSDNILCDLNRSKNNFYNTCNNILKNEAKRVVKYGQ